MRIFKQFADLNFSWSIIAFFCSLFGLTVISLYHGLSFLLNDELIQDIYWFSTTHAHLSFLVLVSLALSYAVLFIKQKEIHLSFDQAEKIILIAYLISIISLPLFSRDLFAYLEFGRLWSVYQLNPYLTGYSSIQDVYSPYAWFGHTTNYGPLATLLSYIPGLGTQVSAGYGVFLYKIQSLIVSLGFVYVLKRLLQQLQFSPVIFLLICLHPLILVEGLINTHNDLFMLPVIVLMIGFIHRQEWWKLCLAAAILPLFKTPLGIITAFIAVYFLMTKKIRQFVAICGLTVFGMALFLMFLGSLNAIGAYTKGSQLVNAFSFLGTCEWFVKQIYFDRYAKTGVILMYEVGPKIGSLLSLFFLLFISWKRKHHDIFQSLSIVMMVIVFFCATQYWPWYGLWFVLFPFFATEDRFRKFGVLVGLTGFVIYSPLFSRFVDMGFEKAITRLALPLIFLQYFLIFVGYHFYKKHSGKESNLNDGFSHPPKES